MKGADIVMYIAVVILIGVLVFFGLYFGRWCPVVELIEDDPEDCGQPLNTDEDGGGGGGGGTILENQVCVNDSDCKDDLLCIGKTHNAKGEIIDKKRCTKKCVSPADMKPPGWIYGTNKGSAGTENTDKDCGGYDNVVAGSSKYGLIDDINTTKTCNTRCYCDKGCKYVDVANGWGGGVGGNANKYDFKLICTNEDKDHQVWRTCQQN